MEQGELVTVLLGNDRRLPPLTLAPPPAPLPLPLAEGDGCGGEGEGEEEVPQPDQHTLAASGEPATSVQRLVDTGALPIHLRASLNSTLQALCRLRQQEGRDQRDAARLVPEAAAQTDELPVPAPDFRSSLGAWARMYREEHIEYAPVATEPAAAADGSTTPAPPSGGGGGPTYTEMYREVIQSPLVHDLLQQERHLARNVAELVLQRDRALKALRKKQMKEIDGAVSGLGRSVTDQHVNSLTTQHMKRMEMLEANYSSELRNLRSLQRRDYQAYITTVYAELKAGETGAASGASSPLRGSRQSSFSSLDWGRDAGVRQQSSSSTESASPRAWGKGLMTKLASKATAVGMRRGTDEPAVIPELETPEPVRLEESFTVQLGTQLKRTHNIRLLTGDIIDLLRLDGPDTVDDDHHAKRLMSAMSLYSQNISAAVLLVDTRINSYTGIKRSFKELCEQSTDFHFPDLEDQLRDLQDTVARQAAGARDAAAQQEGGEAPPDETAAKLELHVGDFYVTRHSNLSDAQVVVHLAVDHEQTISDSLSTRDQSLIGLRNVIRYVFQNNILNLTVPLMMVHELNADEVTKKWCLRRAELMLKCIKGFIMENAAWGGTESRTFQFLVPQGTSVELFEAFSSLLSSVFRVSSAVSLS